MADIRKGERVKALAFPGRPEGTVAGVDQARGRVAVLFDGENEPREVRADSLRVVAVGGYAEHLTERARAAARPSAEQTVDALRPVTIPMWAALNLLRLAESAAEDGDEEFDAKSTCNAVRNAVDEARK